MKEPRNIYFVRHGQTVGNIAKTTQGPDTQLTQQGIDQAHQVAKRFNNIDFDTVVASSYDRAYHTGQIIAEDNNRTVDRSELFREVQRPLEIVDLHADDEFNKQVYQQIQENWGVPGWQYSQEDNFEMAFARVNQALDYISKETIGDIVVVSHGNFMRMLIIYVLTGSNDPEHYRSIFHFSLLLSNTGISHATYDDQNGWRFVSINDSTHLS